MVDNFDNIMPFLIFESSDDFYFLQILQRKKENELLDSNSRIIKNYFIKSVDDLLKHKNEIIKLCDFFNARAGIRLNKRSFKKVAFTTLEKISVQLSQENYVAIRKTYLNVCGFCHSDHNKKWILDLDGEYVKYKDIIIECIDKCKAEERKIYATLPSKNGLHIISSPFALNDFNKFMFIDFKIIWSNVVSIHKDNPTNLYIP